MLLLTLTQEPPKAPKHTSLVFLRCFPYCILLTYIGRKVENKRVTREVSIVYASGTLEPFFWKRGEGCKYHVSALLEKSIKTPCVL